jgi:hypothetical protein
MIAQTRLPFKIEQTSENLTAHAGLAVAHEFNLGVGLQRLLNGHLPPPGSNRGHKPAEWIMPLILMLQGGGDDLADIKVIAQDAALRTACRLEKIPDESTLGDLLRRTGHSPDAMDGLADVECSLTRKMLLEGTITNFTLDADATIIPAGKYDAAVCYDGTKGYQPMLGFLAENRWLIYNDFRNGNASRWLIYNDFRNGNASPTGGVVDVIKTAQARMPDGTRIARFRSDSAAYNHHVTDYCDDQGIHFAIGAECNQATTQLYNNLKTTDWVQFTTSNRKRREVAQTIHAFDKGTGSFRLIFVRDTKTQGELFASGRRGRAIISNFPPERSAVEIVNWYNGRGAAENYIKEVKYGFGLRRVPCGQLTANAAWCRIAAIAYNLFLMQQALALPEHLATSSITTVRWHLYSVAARLVRHGRRLILKIAADAPTVHLLENIRSVAHRLAVQYGYT